MIRIKEVFTVEVELKELLVTILETNVENQFRVYKEVFLFQQLIL